MAEAAGIENPTREQLARLDRKRKKKGSNKEWKNPYDPDARIAKMKDGSTHMASLSSGALLAATLQGADEGGTTTIHETLSEAGDAVAEMIEHEAVTAPSEEPKVNLGGIEEDVSDKGYHSGGTLKALNASPLPFELGVRIKMHFALNLGYDKWPNFLGNRATLTFHRKTASRGRNAALLRPGGR